MQLLHQSIRNPQSAIGTLFTLLALILVSRAAAQKPVPPGPHFREAAASSGLNFRHFNGASGEYFMPEIMGSGVALFDYDNDGDSDLFLIQGTELDTRKGSKLPVIPFPQGQPRGHRLFRNDLAIDGSGARRVRFVDVTVQAGLSGESYGMGAAVGDYDNDGNTDFYVTNFGSNVLYHNNGNGTFSDVTRKAGVDDPRWSTSAAFLDYDHDGDLDLFVLNYLDFTVAGNKTCYEPGGGRDYCNPSRFNPVPSRFFRNEGGGRFVDVTETTGVNKAYGPGLGVACADFNRDGWIDMYVANDGTANQLWLNKGNGIFEEKALLAGCAYNADGVPQGSMGVTAGDYDNDGDDDLFITNLTREGAVLYRNEGAVGFSDVTARTGLLALTFLYTGFGTEWFDYDNDGNLDLFVANGAVTVQESLRATANPYRQKNQLLHARGDGRFEDGAHIAGPAFQLSEVSRGAAFGDIDNDGDIDVVVTNNNGPVRLLLNETSQQNHWLEVRLEGVRDNRNGLGARVQLQRKGEAPLWRHAHTDGSYISANDSRIHFGLGRSVEIDAVVVYWPAGGAEEWHNIRADSLVKLRQGTGERR